MSDLTAFILAGGKSSRMGANKAFLELAGKTLLARALELGCTVTKDVRIVGPRTIFEGHGPVIEDIYSERGALGGIHAALTATPTDLNLMLAVDTPFLAKDFLRHLVSEARSTAAMITVPRVGGRLQPLCAVYHRGFVARAETALKSGNNKIDPLFAPAETRVIEETELARLGFSAASFDNLNTWEEWERVRQLPLSW
ncbi:MAG: molybdenum cofactor guanylyltransferase [Terriglobales bacterium]